VQLRLATRLFEEKPLLPSIENVTVPPGVLEEVTFAVRLTLPPEIAFQGTFTLEVVRLMAEGAGPPPLPPVDPPPQPAKPRNKNRVQAIAAPGAKRRAGMWSEAQCSMRCTACKKNNNFKLSTVCK